MTTIQDIQRAIMHLSPEALQQLRAWYEQFDAHRWDEQLTADIHLGRLDHLAAEAIRAFDHGETTPL